MITEPIWLRWQKSKYFFMKFEPTALPEVIHVQPRVFPDSRGAFLEAWHEEKYAAGGLGHKFVQDNLSHSKAKVLRGLHFQTVKPQGKLVSCSAGRVFDVAVDIRQGSPNYKKWVGVELSAEKGNQLYVPEGFAHGFCVLSEEASVTYKCTAPYLAEYDAGILWNDPEIGVEWPVDEPLLSDKDAALPSLAEFESGQ